MYMDFKNNGTYNGMIMTKMGNICSTIEVYKVPFLSFSGCCGEENQVKFSKGKEE